MIKPRVIKNYKYASRLLNFHCVVDDLEVPILAPSLYLFHQAISGLSNNSIRAYSFDISKFFNVLNGTTNKYGEKGLDYRDLSDEQMSAYLHGYLKKYLKLADTTIERHIASLTKFYEFAYSHGLMSLAPKFSFEYGDESTKTSVMQGLTTRLHKTYIDEEDFNKVVLSNITVKDPFLRERNEIALMLGYHAGFRTADLIGRDNLCVKKLRKLLPREDKRVPTAIKLNIQEGKGNKSREVQLTVNCTTKIYDFLWGRAEHIKTTLMCNKAGKPLTNEDFGTQTFRDCINTYLAKTNLNVDDTKKWENRSYHILRACYATNAVMFCYDKGLDPRVFVTQWMGHEDPQTTEIYIFYDAVLKNRIKILEELNLNSTLFGKSYKKKFMGMH